MNRFRKFARQVSKNHTKPCYVLKCDIRKFFTSIDQKILMEIVDKRIEDKQIVALIRKVVKSFNSGTIDRGLPLGNLTSQLLVNVYMNEFDQFVKHQLKVKHYVRYADDFVILSRDHEYLKRTLSSMTVFLRDHLRLALHPNKVFIKSFASGVDFLGFVHFQDHLVLRTATKRRMLKRLYAKDTKPETMQSYLGLLRHGNTYKLRQRFPVDFR